MVQGGMKCIKYILFFFNLVFVAIGIILIAVGVSTKVGFTKHLTFLDPEVLEYPPNLFIAAGAIIFIIAFLGCFGSWKESHCMMMTYSVLLGLLLVLELGAAFSAFALKDDVEGIVIKGMLESQKSYNKTGELGEEVTKSWDAMQNEWHCCGTNNYTDWAINSTDLIPIPFSCCIDDHPGCTTLTNGTTITAATPIGLANQTIYTEGCFTEAVKEVTLEIIGVVGIVVAIVELLGIIFACLMARSIRYSYETV